MEQEIEAGKLKEALATISPFYYATELTAEDQKQLLEDWSEFGRRLRRPEPGSGS